MEVIGDDAFNRTIVELKPFRYMKQLCPQSTFNRTIVELKLNAP